MKTIEEWLMELPEPHRTKAFNNLKPERRYLECKSTESALIEAFSWNSSIEGKRYWIDVCVDLITGEFEQLWKK